MTLGGCSIHRTSKLQTEIALPTLEVEYIALAQGMREFVHLSMKSDDFSFKYCYRRTEEQKADLFTKGFNQETFVTLRMLLCGW